MARAISLSTVVTGNDYRASLIAVRDKLARAIDDAIDGAELATLSRQMVAVLDKIQGIPNPEAVTRPDEIASDVTDQVAIQRQRRAALRAGGAADLDGA